MSQSKSQICGFTLIELTVVVAIIGVLAAIALSQYQTYVPKSQVARVVGETGNQRIAVEDCVLSRKLAASATSCAGTATGSNLLAGGNTVNGSAPADTRLGAPQLSFPDTTGAAILTSTFGNSAAAVLSTKRVVWMRDADGTWTCSTDVDIPYRPQACTADTDGAGD